MAGWSKRWTFLVWLATLSPALAVLPYDLVYVRQPRFGDTTNSTWGEVFHPARMDPGADLMLLHTNGTEEVLVAGGLGSVTDPFISFDGQWCYYALFPNLQVSELNYQRADLPYEGCDIYKIHLATRQIVRLTFQEFTPHTGAGNWLESNPVDPPSQFNRLGYGILNLGPCPVPGGKIAFVSNRRGLVPPKDFTAPTLQLYVMDEDGANVTPIAPMNIGSALHPTPLLDGRVMFSSYESQGLRDRRLWGIWAIWPDGRRWEPVVSAFREPQAFHFMTQLSDGDIVVVDYYNLNNNGFGALYRFPAAPPPGTPGFYSAFVNENPSIDQTIEQGFSYPFSMPFTPYGMFSIVPFTHGNDEAAPVGTNGVRVGKFTHPSGAPGNDLLCVWTPGPANDLNRPTTVPYYDAGLYLIPGGNVITNPDQLVLIKNSPQYNEAWPRAVVAYSNIYGVPEPHAFSWLPNDGTEHVELPEGTPFGLVGTSSFYKRESFPGFVVSWSDTFDGLDAFNTSENGQSINWFSQGSDAGLYANSNIFAVRVLSMEPHTHRSYGPNEGQHFFNHANERLRILGEIPLRKFDTNGLPILDSEGNPDTSFLAKLPADTPFTFQMLDQNAMVLTMAQTWHQLRPGEVRNNCGGCHAHSQQPLHFTNTYASRPDYEIPDLNKVTPWLRKIAGQTVAVASNATAVNVEFLRDIRPILTRSCVPCHTSASNNPPGNLVLDDYANYNGLPGDYARLANDTDADWGYPPVIGVGAGWRQSNASRYIRMFQSRRSLLAWKVFGARMDGWSNADHPTESTPGVAATLPPGADPNAADLDFTGTIMPPTNSTVPALSDDEKMNIARWIDLGCPIDQDATYGWFLDDLPPTLTVSRPRQNGNHTPLSEIRIGIADAYSGINTNSLSITADFEINGIAPSNELKGLGSFVGDGIFAIPLSTPVINMATSHVTATVYDNQTNKNVVKVRFWVEPLGADSSVVHADMQGIGQGSGVLLRFKDLATNLNHVVYGSDALTRPFDQWTPLSQLEYTNEANSIRRIRVQLPPAQTNTYFFRVQKP